ncbi:Tlg2-vesicle protein [Ophidiomyces ophidiicola]|nr:Tlg2-vesicle protein [Ophidiomyces ophidiicola]
MPMHSHLDAAELLPASPLSREQSISPGLEPIRPPWSRPRSSLSRRRRTSSTFSLVASVGFRDKAINRIRRTYIRLYDLWTELTVWQKVVTVFAFLVVSAFTVGFMILSGHIFKWLEPVAADWEKSPLVMWLFVCWIVFATATVVGSTCAFILSRTIFSEFVHRIIKHDKRFAALALTLKYDGLKLLCMIRLCPLPYSVCNGAISTFPTVQPLMYGLATAIITPKLFVATFIGSRLRILAQSGEKMGAIPKAINITSIIIGVCIGIFTGCTLARAAELEAEERAILAQAASDPSQLPPPGSFADDPDEYMAASNPLDRDEEEQIGFRDQERELRRDIDNDHVAIDTRGYQDELTDNDSDIFGEGDGEIDDTYSLHRRT